MFIAHAQSIIISYITRALFRINNRNNFYPCIILIRKDYNNQQENLESDNMLMLMYKKKEKNVVGSVAHKHESYNNYYKYSRNENRIRFLILEFGLTRIVD